MVSEGTVRPCIRERWGELAKEESGISFSHKYSRSPLIGSPDPNLEHKERSPWKGKRRVNRRGNSQSPRGEVGK